MAINQIKTFLDIQNAIIGRAKIKDESDSRAQLREKINTAQRKIAFSRTYRWSGETRSLVLKGQYATGTVTATNGSHAITGSSTAWAELSHLRWKIKIGSDRTPYRVRRVGSTTSITIEPAYQGTSASSLAYVLYKDEYGLFPDLQDIRKLYIPQTLRRIYPRGPDYVDEFRFSRPFFGGLPKMYTINGKNVYHEKTWANFLIDYDFWEDPIDTPTPRDKNLILYPAIFPSDYTAQIRYTKIPPPMSEDTDEPLIYLENREVLVYSVLKENFLQNRDLVTKREWEGEYKKCITEMESDVESVDDDMELVPDRSGNRRSSCWSTPSEFDV